MKVNDIRNLLTTIKIVQEDKTLFPSVRFSYMLARNSRHLEVELRDIETIVSDGIDMTMLRSFESDRIAALTERSIKNEDGSPVINGYSYVLDGDPNIILSEITKVLTDKYPDAESSLRTITEREKEFEDKELEVPLVTLSLDFWPNISPGILDKLFLLVKEDS